jgi:FkbM family methyltransferase
MLDSTEAYIWQLPLSPEEKQPITAAVSCTDCDGIPKVPQAGETFTGPAGPYQLMHNGVKIIGDCYYGRWMTEIIRILKGHHEPQEEKVFHEVLRYVSSPATMLELGSFWAYYSLWFHRHIEGARCYLIEPDPNNLEMGKRNFALNDAIGQFFNYSIGRASGKAEPFVCESDGVERLIPKTSIDDFLSLVGLHRVDILLADIQGAELEMLEGAADSIDQRRIRFMFLSTHHHSISNDPLTHQKCLQFLKDHKARIIAEHSVSESYTSDGLIVASISGVDQQPKYVAVSRNRASSGNFREIEYDLKEAWEALAQARQELAEMELKCAHLEKQLQHCLTEGTVAGNVARGPGRSRAR